MATRSGTRSAHAHAAAVTSSRTTDTTSGTPISSGTPGSGPNGSPVVRDSAHTPTRNRLPARPIARIRLLRIRAEQERPAELHLGAEHEEEPEPPPLGEVLGSDGEVHERGAGGGDRRNRERQRHSPAQADQGDEDSCGDRGAQAPRLKAEQGSGEAGYAAVLLRFSGYARSFPRVTFAAAEPSVRFDGRSVVGRLGYPA